MRRLSLSMLGLLAGGSLLLVAGAAQAAVNIVADHTDLVIVTGAPGVLRVGSPWGPGSTPSSDNAPVDGDFETAGQQWNNGSFWWDQDPTVNADPVAYEIFLDAAYTLNRFVVQADDNDSYLIEWWDGAAWQDAYAVPFQPSFGLVTRDSGVIPAITTDRLRFTATAGDNYYALSELQAFAVPEPASWALMIAGFGLSGAALRRRRALAVPV